MRLTEAQRRALKRMSITFSVCGIRFDVGEALRRRGLACRYTEYIERAEYASKDEIVDQGWRGHVRHEWHITPDGRAALAQSVEKK
jgi:hypothetical protein